MSMRESQFIIDVVKCANFAAVKHRFQRRKDTEGTPYINHPIGVAHILTEEAHVSDLATIQAAILHDTVEDTETTFDEITEIFGREVCDIVREVTDDKLLPSAERKRLQVVHAPTTSHKAKLVKLADKLYNLRDMTRQRPVGWRAERVRKYYEWAYQVVEGLRGTNQELEAALDVLFKEKGVGPTNL